MKPNIKRIVAPGNILLQQIQEHEQSFFPDKNNSSESSYSISSQELSQLYIEQQEMKVQIMQLKKELKSCQGKWNKVVKNVIKENVQLKYEIEQLKKELKRKEKSTQN